MIPQTIITFQTMTIIKIVNIDDIDELLCREDKRDDTDGNDEVLDEYDELLELRKENKRKRDELSVMLDRITLEKSGHEEEHRLLLLDIEDVRKKKERLKNVMNHDVELNEVTAMTENRTKAPSKSFFKMREANHSNFCLLTPYDRNIHWMTCDICRKQVHLFCQLTKRENSSDQFICDLCTGEEINLPNSFYSLNEKEEHLSQEVKQKEKDIKNSEIAAASVSGKIKGFMGKMRIELQHKLENEIGARKNEYHSHSLVGNNTAKVVKNYKKLTDVFTNYPELKKGYDSLFEAYETPFHFMRKKDWLSEEEITKCEEECNKIGVLYPRVLKRSIPSKVDDLIFIIPKFAKKFKTLGGLREEDVERLHNETNRILTVLASVREHSVKFLLTLERMELKSSSSTTLGLPIPRRFRCKQCADKPYIVDSTCDRCGWKRARV